MTLTALTLAVTVAGLGLILVRSHSNSRNQLVTVFNQQERVGAALFEALLSGTFADGGAPQNLSGPTVTQAELLADNGEGMESNAVYTASGQLLASHVFVKGARPVPAAMARQVLRDVQTGTSKVWLSNVLMTPAGPSLAIATEFRARGYGTRVELTGFPLTLVSALLPNYLNTMNETGGESFLLDGSNAVVATSVPNVGPGTQPPDPSLLTAIRRHPQGAYTRSGAAWHFTVAGLPNTNWRLVLAVPDSTLFAPVSGESQLIPWELMALLLLCGCIVLMFVRRARRDAQSLAYANEKLEQRNAEVEEANRAKTTFLAGMSHELRTPLNGIIGFAELMYDERVGPVAEEHREFLGYMLTSAQHLLTLINGVLDLSKVEAGKLEFDRQPLDLTPFIEDIQATLRPLAEERQIELSSQVDPALGVVWVDESRFRQIVLNYASNALKFTEPGGRVSIGLMAADAGMLRLEVEDTGIGIAADELDHLFSEFSQLQRGRATSSSGTGLGLALTKRLVEAQGGTVGVVSEPGIGSTFSATLPCAAPPQANAEGSTPPALVVTGDRR
jgi:signal transduction histidine kinase